MHRAYSLVSAGAATTHQWENSSDPKLSFIHRGLRLLSLCRCSSAGGVAPCSPKILKPPFLRSPASTLSLMWDVAKLARGASGQCVSSANWRGESTEEDQKERVCVGPRERLQVQRANDLYGGLGRGEGSAWSQWRKRTKMRRDLILAACLA